MSSFRNSPYSLVFDDAISVKIKAHNSRGWSSESTAGTGINV